ncbi:MAG: 50S ribosomal protein L19e [Nanoarchaeota archaeon]
MKLKVQKKLAASLLGCSRKRIRFDPARLDEIKEAITKTDIRGLIADRMIWKKQEKGVSRVRARKILRQKRKGLQKSAGSRKGSANARAPEKLAWMRKIRIQRAFLKELKQKKLITTITFTHLYRKAKGGFFRSVRHIKIYLEENKLVQQAKK